MRGAVTFVRLVSCVCTLIVAAIQPLLASSAAVSEDVPVPGSTAALAQALGISPVPERARFMSEMTRLVYDATEFRPPAVAAFLTAIRQPPKNAPSPLGPPNARESVPVPLTTDVWADAVFRRRVGRDDLVASIVADRQASLLCYGLTRLDDETLEFLAAHPGMLTRIYERTAPIFAAFSSSFRIHDNRVVPPGGAAAVPLWESVVGEKVARPDRFVQTLLEINEGRLAYLYDTIGQLDPAHRAFALGTWMPGEAVRLERFRALATTGMSGIREWHVRVMPFGRSSFDFGMALLRIAVDEQGRPRPPASRGFWSRVFGSEGSDDTLIDAAWLAESVVSTDVRQRGERLDQITFAQRVFGANDDRAEQTFVLRAMPRFRAPLLTFERAGLRSAATMAATVRHASRLSGFEGRRGYVIHAQFQSALALLSRMAAVRTIDVAAFERLIQKLTALPLSDSGSYSGGIARWLREDLLPALPPARDMESAVIAGLSGRPSNLAIARRITWEGQRYRLDLTATEQLRLQRVRDRQDAPRLDLPLQMADAAQMMRSEKVTIDDLQDIATQFNALAADLPLKSREEEADGLPSAVAPPPPVHETLKRAVDEINRAVRNKDFKRAARAAEPIVELADDLLARNLLSFAYAISLGDPEGTVLLADDVSHRHDFGFGVKDADVRSRILWAVPRQEVAPGVPWHVAGSVLGLDMGLSTLSLRRVATDHMLEAPKLTSNARDAFAASVSLLDPLALRDEDRDVIAAAVAAGRQRVAAVDASNLDRIADELSLDAARHRAMSWTLTHGASDLTPMFSLTELLVLGGGRVADLQAWGMAVVPVNGCFCQQLLRTAAWGTLAGRPQLGLSAAVLPDVNFRIAVVLKELDLPAPLAKVILSAAMQDFIDEVRPTDDGDWLSLSRTARAIPRERIEDYIAAATANGPLMPDIDRSPAGVR